MMADQRILELHGDVTLNFSQKCGLSEVKSTVLHENKSLSFYLMEDPDEPGYMCIKRLASISQDPTKDGTETRMENQHLDSIKSEKYEGQKVSSIVKIIEDGCKEKDEDSTLSEDTSTVPIPTTAKSHPNLKNSSEEMQGLMHVQVLEIKLPSDTSIPNMGETLKKTTSAFTTLVDNLEPGSTLPALTWVERLRIGSQIAEGLIRLEGNLSKTFLDDLKLSNILLDEAKNANFRLNFLSDCKMKGICRGDSLQQVYCEKGKAFSKWSAFGFILLQLLTGEVETGEAWKILESWSHFRTKADVLDLFALVLKNLDRSAGRWNVNLLIHAVLLVAKCTAVGPLEGTKIEEAIYGEIVGLEKAARTEKLKFNSTFSEAASDIPENSEETITWGITEELSQEQLQAQEDEAKNAIRHGQCQSKAGEHDLAFKNYGKALSLLSKSHPNTLELYMLRADCCLNFTPSNPMEALEEYGKVLQLQPQSRLARFRRAELYESRGIIDLALEDFCTILKANPGDEESKLGMERCLTRIKSTAIDFFSTDSINCITPDAAPIQIEKTGVDFGHFCSECGVNIVCGLGVKSCRWRMYELCHSCVQRIGVDLSSFETFELKKRRAEIKFFLESLGYSNGVCNVESSEDYIQLLQAVAMSGNAYAQCDMGIFLQRGSQGESRHFVHLFTIVASANYPQGKFLLGRCYEEGKGVNVDFETALALYTDAAEHNHCGAMLQLGKCLLEGRGRLDMQTGALWLKRGALLCHRGCQFRLAMCYLTGEGVNKDSLLAYKWLEYAGYLQNSR